MMVFSFSIVTFLARPSIAQRDVFQLDAKVIGDHLAAGQDRDVFKHRFATIAEARSLDRRDLHPPRSLLTTRVASASPSMSSATIRRGLPVFTTASSKGSSSCNPDSFFS